MCLRTSKGPWEFESAELRRCRLPWRCPRWMFWKSLAMTASQVDTSTSQAGRFDLDWWVLAVAAGRSWWSPWHQRAWLCKGLCTSALQAPRASEPFCWLGSPSNMLLCYRQLYLYTGTPERAGQAALACSSKQGGRAPLADTDTPDWTGQIALARSCTMHGI